MVDLSEIYMVLLPLVLAAALVEGVWLSRSAPEGYDWKASATARSPTWPAASCSLRAARPHRAVDSPGPRTIACSRRRSTMSAASCCSSSASNSSTTGSIASATPRAGSGTPFASSLAQPLHFSAAYRLGWLGRFTGATLFFTPLVLLGFTPTVVLIALLLNLLYQFWIHADWIPRLGWLEGVFNTPSAPSRPSRAQSRVSRRQLRRRADRLRPAVRHLHRRARRRAVRLRAVTPVSSRNPFVINFSAVDRPVEGPAPGALARRGLDVPVRPAGLAARRQGPDHDGDPPPRRPGQQQSAVSPS